MPFKHNAARRHHIRRARYRVTNWPAYKAGLRRRGDLTFWVDEAALAGWQAPRRSTPGEQHRYPDLLGLDLAVPDHTTLSRRAETLQLPQPKPHRGDKPMHLLVDSTGLKLCGAGEWLLKKRGTKPRRAWRTLHIGTDADTGEIVAATLTGSDVCDASQVAPLLDQVPGPVASFAADGAYDWDSVYGEVAGRHPEAAVVVPPRANAVPSSTAETGPTQRDRHLQLLRERGRVEWQEASGYKGSPHDLLETAR